MADLDDPAFQEAKLWDLPSVNDEQAKLDDLKRLHWSVIYVSAADSFDWTRGADSFDQTLREKITAAEAAIDGQAASIAVLRREAAVKQQDLLRAEDSLKVVQQDQQVFIALKRRILIVYVQGGPSPTDPSVGQSTR